MGKLDYQDKQVLGNTIPKNYVWTYCRAYAIKGLT